MINLTAILIKHVYVYRLSLDLDTFYDYMAGLRYIGYCIHDSKNEVGQR